MYMNSKILTLQPGVQCIVKIEYLWLYLLCLIIHNTHTNMRAHTYTDSCTCTSWRDVRENMHVLFKIESSLVILSASWWALCLLPSAANISFHN